MPREKQLELCHEAVNAVDGVPELENIYEPHEFDLFVKNLRKANEVAVVARLMALAEKKPKGNRRPGIAFVLRLMRLRDASLYIVDAEAGLSSKDGDKWYEHVESTANKIMRGRPLSSERAAELAAMSNQDRLPGLVDEWLSPVRAADRQRVGQHWRDPSIKSAKQAIATVPEEFAELRTASRSTMERIFGGRTSRSKRKP